MKTSPPTDEKFMRMALRLARRGLARTSPNPMVGAVIVKDGRIISQGYHHFFGGDHAEVDALKNAREEVSGATLYVTLEPCRHYGKTPPCVEAIIRAGIGRVVIGMKDPDKRVSGRSIAMLKERGIAVQVGVLEADCQSLNETYIKHRTTGMPYVTLKFAQTLDGRIATAGGSSRWISSATSLKMAHRLRARSDAVLVGAGTVLKDNPELTTRLIKGRNPLRVVLDSNLRIPPEVAVFKGQDRARTVVATTAWDAEEKLAALRRTGVEVLIVLPDADGRVDLKELLKTLGERDISSVLVEGGAETITSFLRLGLADKVIAIIAPKILGRGTETVGELNITDVNMALKLSFTKVYRSGEDIILEGRMGQSPEVK
jgi:diaminohydroxyphosphoribosylaminopyrimidine deaminase/5-amino-6-(5-phosphoribosylamino)uracil reductase